MQELTSLYSISPIDGRYHQATQSLSTYFSEFALFKYRVKVEVAYFLALCRLNLPQLPVLTTEQIQTLQNIYIHFNEVEALKIKEIEKLTNHDIKAVEYYIKYKFDEMGLIAYKEFIHFGLTSQDINNTAIPLSLNEAFDAVYYPQLAQLLSKLVAYSEQWKNIPMLAHTHGQPASPTRLGKEFQVFVERLSQQITTLQAVPYAAKFGGATGNFNAHVVAFPEIDWKQFVIRNWLNYSVN
jgi:adenylosuccinate lyase